MFEKFGEFDSAEEINRAAAAQLKEGDEEAIFAIAKENGIDREDAEDYIDGVVDELVTPLMAAYGKIAVEEAELKPYEIMEDWITYIKQRCAEDIEMAVAVRRKGKSLEDCIAEIMKWSFKNAKPIPDKIKKKCGINFNVSFGNPGMATVKQLITKYYKETKR